MRDLAWFADQRAHHAADCELAVLANADQRGGRQAPLCRIGDDTKGRERQIMRGGDPCRYMRFHVGSDGARRHMQGPLAGRIGHRKVDARHVDDRHVAQSLGEPLRPAAMAYEIFGAFRDDSPRHERGAGPNSRRQAARDPEADDA